MILEGKEGTEPRRPAKLRSRREFTQKMTTWVQQLRGLAVLSAKFESEHPYQNCRRTRVIFRQLWAPALVWLSLTQPYRHINKIKKTHL